MRIAKSPSELGFNRYDEPRLAKALERATGKRIFQRLQAVLLVAQGLTADEVAVIENVSAQAVYSWVYRYLGQHQVASPHDLPRSGRPPTAKQITDARILQEMRRNPLQLGYRTTTWTVELLADHLSRSAVGLVFWITGTALFETLMLRRSLSPRQIVTSIASALSRLISLLLQHQAFSRTRTPGIHFAEASLLLDDCLTAPRSPSGAS